MPDTSFSGVTSRHPAGRASGGATTGTARPGAGAWPRTSISGRQFGTTAACRHRRAARVRRRASACEASVPRVATLLPTHCRVRRDSEHASAAAHRVVPFLPGVRHRVGPRHTVGAFERGGPAAPVDRGGLLFPTRRPSAPVEWGGPLSGRAACAGRQRVGAGLRPAAAGKGPLHGGHNCLRALRAGKGAISQAGGRSRGHCHSWPK